MPTRVITGRGCVCKSAEQLAAFGRRCLIVTGASAARACGALADVTAALESRGMEYDIYNAIRPNPSIESCVEGGRKAAEFGADFILGIGGGSPLDAAKIIAVSAANPDLDPKGLYALRWPKAPLPIVLVGTTAGTGSEVTPVAVITDTDGRKRSFRQDCLYAALALGDPRYTEAMSYAVTATTGVDALAHCLESYFSTASTSFSEAFALRGTSVLLPPLRSIAERRLPTREQREALYAGSLLGGLSISVTGTLFPHNMGYYLTENHGVPHGFACAVFLPFLLAHAAEAEPERTAALCRAADTTVEELTAAIRALTPAYDFSLTQEEVRALLPRWKNHASVKKAVGGLSAADVERILTDVFVK